MNPSPEAVALIRAKVATLPGNWAGNTDSQLVGPLNAPSVANPASQGTAPKPFTVSDVFGAVSPGSLAKLTAVAFVPDIRDKLQANDVPGCNLYANLLLAGAVITQADHDAILAVVNAAQPDPSYQPQISWAAAALGRPVDTQDIAASRPGVS